MKKENRSGFTLIELLIVMAIIVLLGMLTIPNIIKFRVKAKEAVARVEISQLETSIVAYERDNGAYPSTDATFSSKPLVDYLGGDMSRLATKPKKEYYPFKENRIAQDGTYLSPLLNPYFYDAGTPAIGPAPARNPTNNKSYFDMWTKDRHDNPQGINNWK